MRRSRWMVAAICCGVMWATGCDHWKPKPADQYVYVTAKGANLRDRVAAVSNRTGAVQNGDKLKVLDHGRHWLKVQSPKGEVGWIEEKAVASGEAEGAFTRLAEENKGDPEVAGGVVRDQVYMHVKPGKETEHFYLLNEGEKLKLLRRAVLVKAVTPGMIARSAVKAIPQAAGSDARVKGRPSPVSMAAAAAPAPPAMEDWWLVRDAEGHTGWVYSRMIDVDAPDALTRYAENQRFVGAYVLTTVHDQDAPGGPADVPVYVTVLSAYKAGLPYDFDQVRVFTWSTAKHRYETGFRDTKIEGYLPITIGKMKDPAGKSQAAQEMLPSFTYKVLSADAQAVMPDAETGAMVPGKTITKTYRMEGNYIHRIGAQAGEQEAHPAVEEKMDKKGKKK